MLVIFRTSDKSKSLDKLPLGNKYICYFNFLKAFEPYLDKIEIINWFDNVEDSTVDNFIDLNDNFFINPKEVRTSMGNSGSFLESLNFVIKQKDKHKLCYFIEDDYVHYFGDNALFPSDPYKEITNILENGYASYITLFDHPDKYSSLYSNGEYSKNIKIKNTHWRSTISTTMTFATSIEKLIKNKEIFEENCKGPIPNDHNIFKQINSNGCNLYTRIPGTAFTTDSSVYPSPFKEDFLVNVLINTTIMAINELFSENINYKNIFSGIESDPLKKLSVLHFYAKTNISDLFN